MYDPSLSYDENYARGPFARCCVPKQGFTQTRFLDNPTYAFLGMPVHLPFGIPAGPLLNARFVEAAWNAGTSVATYKTVRSQFWPSHPHPNVLQIALPGEASSRAPLRPAVPPPAVVASPLDMSRIDSRSGVSALSISNSFGVPSKAPHEWQRDVRRALDFRSELAQGDPALGSRILVLSFQGSRQTASPANATDEALSSDAVVCQRLALESFVGQINQAQPVLEVNLSCPNERGAPIYSNIKASLHLLEALRRNRPDTGVKFIAKIGVLTALQTLDFVRGAKGLVDAIAAINTVSATILSQQGNIILGSGDRTGGVCGELIFQENLEMVERLVEARERAAVPPADIQIVSVGGVTNVERFQRALAAGADHVQAATASMWNPGLARDIAQALSVPFETADLRESLTPETERHEETTFE